MTDDAHDDGEAPPHTDADYPDQWDLPAPAAYHLERAPAADDDDDTEHTSWWPVDLAALFTDDFEPPKPTIFRRDDGICLIYPGKAHAFNGEPESGKSWAALICCVERVNAGENVLYIDCEDTAQTIVTRLLALGANPEKVVAHFVYMSPAEALEWRDKITAAGVDFFQVLEARPFTFAVVDGVTEAMVLHGLDINNNNDVATFYRLIVRPIKERGTAVAQIDHVTKAREGRARGGIGGQHKLAGIDVSFSFEMVTPFGVGKHGIARIIVEKDRPGQLRQHASGRRIAEVHLESDPETHELAAGLKAPPGPTTGDDDWEPTGLMEKVSDYVTECNGNGHHPSQREIEDGVSGKGEYVRQAVARLVARGNLARGADGRRNHQHTIVTPYTEPRAEDDEPGDEPLGDF